MGAGASRGLAGHLILRRTLEYHRTVASELSSSGQASGKRDVTAEARRGFIDWVLSDNALAEALKESLDLASTLVKEREGALSAAGYTTARVDFVLETRGLVGVSSGVLRTVFEVGLSIDRLLGLPYYPASTLKGAARAACEDLASERVCGFLFGSRDSASQAVFTEAYPIGCLKGGLCLIYTGDVVNPHYYRGGQVVESELEAQPVPVVHLAVAEDTVFSTVVAVRDNRWPDDLRGEASRLGASPLDATVNLLLSALLTGFAARSGKGYNVARPLEGNLEELVSRSIVRLVVKPPEREAPQGPEGRAPRRPDRPGGPGSPRGRRGGGRGRRRP